MIWKMVCTGESEGRISDGEGGEEVRKWWIRAG